VVIELTTEDRLALRELVEAYAGAVDRFDVAAVVALFAPEGRMVAPHPAGGDRPPIRHEGHARLTTALDAGLGAYRLLTHVIGGLELTAADAAAGTAAGTTTCLAHHVFEREGRDRLLVLGIKYRDRYVRLDGCWRFAERDLDFQWRDERWLTMQPSPGAAAPAEGEG